MPRNIAALEPKVSENHIRYDFMHHRKQKNGQLHRSYTRKSTKQTMNGSIITGRNNQIGRRLNSKNITRNLRKKQILLVREGDPYSLKPQKVQEQGVSVLFNPGLSTL